MTLHQVKGTSLADQVAGQIRDAIRQGRFKPGTRLVERKLAAELGTSHIPVREALARLTDEGLVERIPRRGARVAGLSLREIDELCSVRTVLEQLVATRVQQRLTPKTQQELSRIVDRMERAALRGQVEEVFDLDRLFHKRLWALADHSVLADVVTQLRSRLDALLRAATFGRPTGEMGAHAQAHRDLLDAITSGSAKRAREAVAAHIEDAAVRLRAQQATADGT
jgi:DNA-binding GntR family transcriptional regulator